MIDKHSVKQNRREQRWAG